MAMSYVIVYRIEFGSLQLYSCFINCFFNVIEGEVYCNFDVQQFYEYSISVEFQGCLYQLESEVELNME